ncbi:MULTISPECIES: EF-P lysine aminoacylase EpmA [unclassified Beijerinckia]|uniref:EF-P lysine aminoacylase EpmA n=1 Tax=unclassified Beijerinckia TaxID=2638183 RepID=UPI00089AACF6|nr:MULTISPECIES: EF-P lysine aminoacylase EpmA [unclassified Beijerinckia]MDH7798203.1 lysyl-tRNA synthetase class 2 [Beijerinckia sp. GAS462]SED12704.1 lysyl-tRNA synthetase, class 2 [Beijerinckia sp. 28-YEA-48]
MTNKRQTASPSPWWSPHVHADRRPFLLARQRIAAACRAWFADGGFCEAEPGILQVSPGNEAHISGFATEIVDPDGERRALYLHSSPEFVCKKLLAAGEERIFALSRVFRNRERGPLHHPEFTMLEWYRAQAPYSQLIADCQGLVAAAARAAGTKVLAWRGQTADPFAPFERLTVQEAFLRHAGIDLLALLGDRDGLAAAAADLGLRITPDDTWSDVFSKVISEKIEPNLGLGRLTVLDEYPLAEAALARPCAHDGRVAERFELYACGVELANAFGELTDAAEQRRRFEAEMAERQRIYGESYPLDEDFLAALAIMPASSGIALGFERLVMLAAGAQRIDQVIWSPVP